MIIDHPADIYPAILWVTGYRKNVSLSFAIAGLFGLDVYCVSLAESSSLKKTS
jgi:hypothetical protein